MDILFVYIIPDTVSELIVEDEKITGNSINHHVYQPQNKAEIFMVGVSPSKQLFYTWILNYVYWEYYQSNQDHIKVTSTLSDRRSKDARSNYWIILEYFINDI